MSREPRKCKDGGACHHGCADYYCFREQFALPLEGSGLGPDWKPIPPFTAVRTARSDRELLDAIERAWETADHPVLRQLSLAVQEARQPRREALAEFRRLGKALDEAKANGQAMVGLDLLRQRVHLHKVWAFTEEELGPALTTPPRYDEVWAEGTAVLDQIAEAGYVPTKHTIQLVGEDGVTVQVMDHAELGLELVHPDGCFVSQASYKMQVFRDCGGDGHHMCQQCAKHWCWMGRSLHT